MGDLNPACNRDPFPDWPFGVNGDRRIIARDEWVQVPLDVDECPYCGFMLDAQPKRVVNVENEWGTYSRIESIKLRCRTVLDKDLSEHLETHSHQPYTKWLPVEEKIREWMQETYQVPPDRHTVAGTAMERALFNE